MKEYLVPLFLLAAGLQAAPPQAILAPNPRQITCQKTQVAVLGAGVSGITAAQALSNHSIDDFVILDRNDYIGGRARHTTFGKKPDGSSYTVELGANWVQGLYSPQIENPIWTLVQKHNVSNVYFDMTKVSTFDETGKNDYFDLLLEIYNASKTVATFAENIQEDTSVRAAFRYAGWDPAGDSRREAMDWVGLALNAATSPDRSSVKGLYGPWLTNTSEHGIFDSTNNFVTDQRGLNTYLIKEAETFLQPNDPRLKLNTIITDIEYSSEGVTVYTSNNTCYTAEYAICTFSAGVLQRNVVSFSPTLPDWKRAAIDLVEMATYTKIFLQFPWTFWDTDSTVLIYADPQRQGHYPAWQPISAYSDFAGSNILMVTVIAEQAHQVESQTEEETKQQIMEVLRRMYPDRYVPEPVDIMYPRWSQWPWAYGSYSTWPVGYNLGLYRNLSVNVDRLWFAGEAGSEYSGYMHGAWFSGQRAGSGIAKELKHDP